MKILTTSAGLFALSLTVAASKIEPTHAPAQEHGPDGEAAVTVKASRLQPLTDLLGKDVHLVDAPADVRATLRELVVLPDGHVEWGIVGYADRQVLVPTELLRWDATQDRFRARTTKEVLDGEPAFDLAAARREGLYAAVERSRVAWKLPTGVVATEMLPDGARPLFLETTFEIATLDAVLASELNATRVHGVADRFGLVDESFVDPASMRIDLVTVATTDADAKTVARHLIPMRALTLCRAARHGVRATTAHDLVLCSSRDVEELANAPLYVPPADPEVVVTEANRHMAYAFFRLLPEPTSAG